MALIDRWNAFWAQDTYNPISPNAKNLYMSLLAIFNRSQWKSDKLGISNGTLSGMSSLNEKQIYAARTELVKAGLIIYTSGKKGAAPKYELTDLGAIKEQSQEQYGSNKGSNTGVIKESFGEQYESDNGEKTGAYIEKDKEKDKEKDIYNHTISPQGEKKQPKPKGDRAKINEIIADQPEELQDPLREFVKMRSGIKKPLTPHALELALKKLYTMSSSPKERVDIVEQTVMNSWQGFYPLKYERQEEDVFTQMIREAREEARYHDNAGDFTGTEAYQDSISPQLF